MPQATDPRHVVTHDPVCGREVVRVCQVLEYHKNDHFQRVSDLGARNIID